MAIIETWYEQDLKRPVKINRLDGNVFSQDNEGNLIGVELFDNGEPAVISGTVSGMVIRADGGTVAISSGTLSENKCSVVLPSAAYAVPGLISVFIKLTSSGRTTTVCAVVAMCYRSSTDIAIDPGTIIPSIQDLIDTINNAISNIPADYSALTQYTTDSEYNDIKMSDFDGYLFQYIDPTDYTSGYYKHDATTDITPDNTLYHFPPVPIIKGKSYFHYDFRNYFSKFIYLDGTVEYFDSSDTQTSGTITAQKNGFAYLTTARPATALFTNKDVSGIGALSYGVHAIPFEQVIPNVVGSANYSSVLPDLDSVINNKTFIMNFADGSTSIPANYPYPSWHGKKTTINWLKAINLSNRFDTLYCTQILLTGNGEILFRYSAANGVFSAWEEYHPQRHIYVEKDGSGDYTSLFSALSDAVKVKGAVVHVGEGTYDLISETGASWWETSGHYGLVLMNNVHVIFSPKSKVVFNYTGSSEWTLEHVSPFNSGEGGFTLEGLTLEVSRCRYPIHDERVTNTDLYTNRYINCSIKMNNTNNPVWSANQCIGGGLGVNGVIEINGCIFESVNAPDHSGIVSYHNCILDAKSRITIKNSVFITGTFRFGYYGVSTEKTLVLVTNCRLNDEPYISQESPDYTNVNGEIISLNNDIV